MANPEKNLNGTIRESSGKGSARKLRKADLIPAVVYSGGKEVLSFSTSPRETTKILLGPLRRNTLIHLELNDKAGKSVAKKTVMVRDLQIDPVMRTLQHIDFAEIDIKKPVSVMVPIALTGKSKTVVAGGQLEQVRHKIKVKCLPTLVPHKIDLDITDLPFGTTHSSDVTLPKNIELAEPPSYSLVTIRHPRGADDEKEVEGETKETT